MVDREILDRMIRIESRLVQLMLHVGLDPSAKRYDTPRITPQVWRFGEKKLPASTCC